MPDGRYLVYEKETGLCVNVIIWDGESPYDPGDGLEVEIMPAGSLAWVGSVKQQDGAWPAPPEQDPVDPPKVENES